MEKDIIVSIVCNTYNHQEYIENTLKGFLNQNVSFQYEVLIYDDASTDSTPEIIRKYERIYPNIIKPIYQKVNMYSQGKRVDVENEARAVGKYIALCEGDDFWINPDKLQKQVDFLEANPEFSLCVHGAIKIDVSINDKVSNITPSICSREFSTEELIYGGGDLFATNSMVYRRKESVIKPDFYHNAPIGDYPLVIFLSLIGKVFYIDEIMSAYRYAVPGSWTQRESLILEKRNILYKKLEDMFQEINEYTDCKFSDIIEKTIHKNDFDLLLAEGNFKEARKSRFREYYSMLSSKRKLVLYLRNYCPSVLVILIKIKRGLLYVIKSY